MNKKYKQQSNTATSSNYYRPLQTIGEDDDDDDEIIVNKTKKIHIPPITILKCKNIQIKDLCSALKIKNFSIRQISIGLKLFCECKEDYDLICENLKPKFEFFTYGTKEEKPYKAVLLGLDKFDPLIIKKKLIDLKLPCLDVKLVTKSNGLYNEQAIYIVYFQRKSITIKELRQNYSVIDYIKVKWDFQRNRSSKLTQCHNCQMLGHGSSRCNVKTFCANCAGNHKTAECTSKIIKCANCKKEHKSSFLECPNRLKYEKIRQRYQPRNVTSRQKPPHNNVRFTNYNNTNYNQDFPNILNQGTTNFNREWNQQRDSNTNNLFSIEEIKNLTLELISNLKRCKSRADQFEVITSLACKFLYE